jgi:hypothetical protein
MPTNGETAPRLGEEFRSRACTLVKNLGYVERINRKFGIDLGADIPSKKRNLARPLFSPNGRTAFDFKSGIRVNIKKEEKIELLNNPENAEFSNVVGGVLLTDNKLSTKDMQRALDAGIHCWDIRYAHFLAKKVEVFKTLVRLNKNPREKQLDDWTTLVPSFGSYEGFVELKAHLFYHNPFVEMNAEKIEEILREFASNSRALVSMGIPVITHMTLHSIAEVTEGAEDKFKELTSPRTNEILRFEPQACFVTSYSIAPWFIYCRENTS